jgi:hypothetical protein
MEANIVPGDLTDSFVEENLFARTTTADLKLLTFATLHKGGSDV